MIKIPETLRHDLVEGDLYEVCLSELGRFSKAHDGVAQVLNLPRGGSIMFSVQIVSGLEYYQRQYGTCFYVALGSPFHLSMKPLTTEENYSIELSFDSLMNQETE